MGKNAPMNLKTYMQANRISAPAMAALIGCPVKTVRNWFYGVRIPRPEQMAAIAAATNGAVTANDFMPPAQSRKAAQ